MRYTMRENCFVDTSTVLKIIIENEVGLLEGLSKYVLHTSTNVLEEASFKIIVASVLGELNVERTNFLVLLHLPWKLKRAGIQPHPCSSK